MNTLIVVESPNKIKKVKEYCGSGYEVMATYGTLYNMKDINLIISNNFSPRYELLKDNLRTINNKKLKDMCKRVKNVIIATDNDREGEHIAYQLCRLCSLSVDTTPRMRFSEISENAIKYALQNTDYIHKGMVYAAQTRQIIDLIIGFTISPILWKNILSEHTGSTLSAGRCQTPTLRLIYDSFKQETNTLPYEYHMVGYFTKYNIPFQCITPLQENWKGGWSVDIKKGDEGFSWNSENFLEGCKNYEYIIELEESSPLSEKPPLPLNTSKIQQLSPFSAKNTMSFLYQLYEMGYITYIRTDVKKYSNSFIEQASNYIVNGFGEEYLNSEIMVMLSNESSQASTAHEAIRPTDILMTPAKAYIKLVKKELNMLYSIIYNHTLESCSTPCQSIQLKCNIQNVVGDDVIPLQFQYTTSQVHFYGWKIFSKPSTTNTSVNSHYNYLNSLRYSSTNSVSCQKLKIYPKSKTNYNSYYTEAKLINKLEMLGIGRPSTYASLTDKLFERKYVTLKQSNGIKMDLPYYELNYSNSEANVVETMETYFFCEEKNKLNIEPLGIEVIEFLLQHFEELFDYEYTKKMEEVLDNITKMTGVDNGIIQHISSEYYNNVTKNISSMNILQRRKMEDKKRSLSDGDMGINQTSRCLGMINGNVSIFIKKGRYGTYVEWTNELGEVNRLSVSNVVGNRPLENISISEIEHLLDFSEKSNVNVEKKNGFVRLVSKNVSIYYGKYGHYIRFKTPVMKKAKIYNLTGFTNDIVTCNVNIIKKWVSEKYNIF